MKHFIARFNKADGIKTEWLAGEKALFSEWKWTSERRNAISFQATEASKIHDRLKGEGITAFILSDSQSVHQTCTKKHITPQQCFENYERQNLA